MYRDPSEFRERFKAYKDGKSVREIYGLPGYAPGKVSEPSPDEAFVESMGPLLYRELLYQGVKNPDVVYKNLIAQLAYESDRGRSRVAREQHNYGGVGWNGKTYFNYKNDADFVHDYVKLMNRRYKTAILADTLYDYAKGIKKLGYFEDTLENYSRNLIGMKSLHKAALAHKNANPDLYKVEKVPAQQMPTTIAPSVSTRVAATIPQEKTIPIADPRNATIAEALRAMWAHTAFENMPKVSDMPIWESPSLPALTPVEYDVTPLKTYAGGKVAEHDEPVITQGRAGSRLDKVDRMMDPDEDDDTKTRVAKRVGKGFTSLAKDAKEWLGLETIDRFATHTQRPSDYVDATLIAAGNIMISKILNSSAKAFIKQYVRSFDDMDARALGEYFFREHPELMTKPQEAWYEELAKKLNSYFLQAIHRRSRAFLKEGVTVNPESISSQLRPEIKIAHLGEKNKYGGIYSASDNTMLVNADRVKDPRTAMRVTGHEDAHAMQSLFEDATGRPYPTRYGAEMEGLFPFTAEQKAKRPGVHIGKEIDASLHEGKMMRYYDTDELGKALDADFRNMSDELYKEYMNNGYFKDIMQNIQSDLDAQKKFMSKLKNGKLPGYFEGELPMGEKKQLTDEEVRLIAYASPHELPLSPSDPVMEKFVEIVGGGKFLKLLKGAFAERLIRDYKHSYKEARQNGWDRSTSKFIAEEEIDNPALNILDKEFKILDLFNNGKLPGYSNGKIRIKPSKRGTFTAAAKKHGASVREFESRVLKNPEKYSKAMVRKALFSRNARSWKH